MEKFSMQVMAIKHEGEPWIALVLTKEAVEAMLSQELPAMAFTLEQARDIYQALSEVIEEAEGNQYLQ